MSPTSGARPTIHRLSPATIARIAAGEVVERPASVVKELVENALDAGATQVHIRLKGGGVGRIDVQDNGRGIPAAELGLAVERYATSKVPSEADLVGIETLGFRGEALAAIASVSHLRLLSRLDGEDRAHGISVEGGAVTGTFVEGAPPGTTVEVADLFFNTPVRRKFLHALAAEQLEILAAVERLYLARPSVAYFVSAEGVEVAQYPQATTLLDAASRALGAEFLPQSFVVETPLPSGARLQAALGRPAVAIGSPRQLFVAINGRSVQNRAIASAVKVAFQDYLPKTRYPIGVLHLDVDAAHLDANVHPTKLEVRIQPERELADEVRRAVREALQGTAHLAEAPERGSSPRPIASSTTPPNPRAIAPPPARSRGAVAESAAQRKLFEERRSAPVAAGAGRPAVRLLGPIFSLYWVGEDAEGLVLIDQHAASERVVFDTLLRDGRLGRQALLEPLTIELTPRQSEALRANRDAVTSAGFEVDAFGGRSYRIRAVPEYRGHRARPEGVHALLEELADGGRPTVPNGLTERVAASLACHAAIRGGDVVERTEMERVLLALSALPSPAYACPHGRPIVVRVPRSRLERWFLRSGP